MSENCIDLWGKMMCLHFGETENFTCEVCGINFTVTRNFDNFTKKKCDLAGIKVVCSNCEVKSALKKFTEK